MSGGHQAWARAGVRGRSHLVSVYLYVSTAVDSFRDPEHRDLHTVHTVHTDTTVQTRRLAVRRTPSSPRSPHARCSVCMCCRGMRVSKSRTGRWNQTYLYHFAWPSISCVLSGPYPPATPAHSNGTLGHARSIYMTSGLPSTQWYSGGRAVTCRSWLHFAAKFRERAGVSVSCGSCLVSACWNVHTFAIVSPLARCSR